MDLGIFRALCNRAPFLLRDNIPRNRFRIICEARANICCTILGWIVDSARQSMGPTDDGYAPTRQNHPTTVQLH